jgi:translation initiation factor 5
MVYRGGTIINIAGLTPVDDPEYRYKMPAVFGKVCFSFWIRIVSGCGE